MKKLCIVLTMIMIGSLVVAQSKKAPKQIEIETIISAIDSGDPMLFAKIITDDSVFKFGNFPPAIGKEEVFKAQTDFFSSVKSTKHTILKTWVEPGSIVAQMEVTYIRLDGSKITLPVTDIFIIKDNKISQTLIYMDITPLYQTK